MATRPAPRQQRRAQEREEAKARRRKEAVRREWWARHRRALLASVVGVVVVGAVAVGLAVTLSPGPAQKTSPPSLHTVIRASAVSSVTDGLGAGWLTDDRSDTLVRFDPATGRSSGAALKLSGRPVAVTTGFGRVWVASMLTDTVEEIRPGGGVGGGVGRVVRTVHVPQGPSGLAVLDGRVWVTSVIAGDLTALNPTTGKVVATTHLPQGAVRLAGGAGRIWVTGSADTVAAVDPQPAANGRLHWRTVTVGRGPLGVAVGDGSVWVANATGGTVSRIDPATFEVSATYKVGSDPVAVAVDPGDDQTFVADGQSSAVTELAAGSSSNPGGKPASATLTGTPRQLVAADGQVWAAVGNPGAVVAIG